MGVTQGWVSEPILLIVVLYLICYLRNIMGGNARVSFVANIVYSGPILLATFETLKWVYAISTIGDWFSCFINNSNQALASYISNLIWH